jgi:alpha-glucosidase
VVLRAQHQADALVTERGQVPERLPGRDDVVGCDRGASIRCVTNLSGGPAEMPAHAGLILASGPLDGGLLPPDTSVWLRT